MIATTFEQSKRLIDAGFEPQSADMCLRENFEFDGGEYHKKDGYFLSLLPEVYLLHPPGEEPSAIPAWSLSTLWDICKKRGYPLNFNTDIDDSSEIIAVIVDYLCTTTQE